MSCVGYVVLNDKLIMEHELGRKQLWPVFRHSSNLVSLSPCMEFNLEPPESMVGIHCLLALKSMCFDMAI
jgi:hypothetical protein